VARRFERNPRAYYPAPKQRISPEQLELNRKALEEIRSGQPYEGPEVPPQESPRIEEEIRELGLKAIADIRSREPDQAPTLRSTATGRVVPGSRALTHDQWRHLVEFHPDLYYIEPPLEEPDILDT
jgi:hypothetical protein